MTDNRQTLDFLFQTNRIEIRQGSILSRPPVPLPGPIDFDRINGMLLGLAVGDALGNTTEGWRPGSRAKQFGEVRGYLSNRHAGNWAVGLPSDDTQLAFWAIEQINMDRRVILENIAAKFCAEPIYGIGSATKQFVKNHQDCKPWYDCAACASGNGALMRIAPVLTPHLRTGTSDLWIDAVLLARLTHNDTASISSCVAFVNMLWQLIHLNTTPGPLWWLENYVEIARDLDSGAVYEPRGGSYSAFRGPLWLFVEHKVRSAYASGMSVVEACNSWYSGAYLGDNIRGACHMCLHNSQ